MNKKRDFGRNLVPIRRLKNSNRVLIKTDKDIRSNQDLTQGRIIAISGNNIFVDVENDAIIYECNLGGKLFTKYKNSSLLAVGDSILFIKGVINSENISPGTIIEIQTRYSKLSRKANGKEEKEHVLASNADNLLILMSATNPDYNKRLIDRYLVACEQGDLEPIICINKIDLVEQIDVFQEDLEVYDSMGIPIFFVSAKSKFGFENFEHFLKDKTTVITGPSGVGKSTLVNLLLGDLMQKVNIVSERTGKGQHTTSSVKLFELPFGGSLIDTPGIREFALWDMKRDEIALYFSDFNDYYLDCKYLPCTHIHEPNCKVIEAVENGLIDSERYQSYLNIYETLQ